MDFEYFEQCDRFRSLYERGEAAWHGMMQDRERVTIEEFAAACAPDGLLDEDETLEGFLADSGDADASIYRSTVDGVPCYFIQTRGFEFIFVRPADRSRFRKNPSRRLT